jgi:hypothetical protein
LVASGALNFIVVQALDGYQFAGMTIGQVASIDVLLSGIRMKGVVSMSSLSRVAQRIRWAEG